MNDLPTRQIAIHCRVEHDLPSGFVPARGVTWDMVHHLLHRLKNWGRR